MPIFVNDLPDTLTKMGIVADAEDFMNGKQAELVLRYLLQWLIVVYSDQNQSVVLAHEKMVSSHPYYYY